MTLYRTITGKTEVKRFQLPHEKVLSTSQKNIKILAEQHNT